MSIVLVNDYLTGRLGEKKVLWNYMSDYIENLKSIDIDIISRDNKYNNNISFEENVKNYIENNYQDCKLIIQNGSWFNLIQYNCPKIILIQDNLRKMNRISYIQENNFKNADYIVSNSNEVDDYYNERKLIQIPLGVDSNVFNIIPNKELLRIEMNLPIHNYFKFGIFVGSFTDTKGWGVMVDIINRRKDIYWLLITKHDYEHFSSHNSRVYKKIDQELLVKLLNCSDFFILPSPSETQCLSAIEANLCGVPTIMRNTGYFTNLNIGEINNIGIVSDTFSDEDINKIYTTHFNPRNIIIHKFSIYSMIEKWKALINSIVGNLGSPAIPP
jgi:glycosyltransferase involved in cell wall biosynthesis